MEGFREGCPQFDCKTKLGESKRFGCSGIKYNGGRFEGRIPERPNINKEMSSRGSNRSHSVSKIRGVYHTLAERGDYRQRKGGRRRLLLPDVYGPKRWGQMETHYRPFRSKQKIKEKIIQDGGLKISGKVDKTRDVGSQTGLEGCLLPRATASFDLEPLQICPKEEGKTSKFFLQEATLRSNNSAVGFYQNSGSPEENFKTKKYHNFGLFRRFPHTGKVQRRGLGTYRNSYQSASGLWIQNKLGKIVPRTSKSPGISRGSFGFGKPDLFFTRRKGSKDSFLVPQESKGGENFKERTRENCRFSQLRSRLYKVGKTLSKTHSKMDECSYFSFSKRCPVIGRRGIQGSLPSMGKRGVPSVANLFCQSQSQQRVNDGCFRRGLVRGPSPKHSLGGLASGMEEPINELERVKGNSYFPYALSRGVGRLQSDGSIRQHDSLVLSEERGFPSLISSRKLNGGNLSFSGRSGYLSPSHSPEREDQCIGRPGFQEGSHRNRMVSRQQVLPVVLSKAGGSASRFVCHEAEQETPYFCLPLPRPRSIRLGRSGEVEQLEPVEVNIPFSSLPGIRGSGWLAELLQRGRLFDSPFLANSALVPSFIEEMSHQIPVTRRHVFIPEIFRSGSLPQQPFTFKSSRLEVVKEAVMAEGLTEYSAYILSRCHRLTTCRQYQSVWTKFLDFLEREGIEHWKVKVVDVVNFLTYYVQVEPRAFKTLFVYKNALRLPLLFKLGLNLDSPILDLYMKGLFNVVPPSVEDRMPLWDVNQVLRWLTSKEFCPPEKARFFRMEQKAFFLILIGSARRLHEICNLSRRFVRKGDSVILLWPEDFKAKNHNMDHAPASPSIRKMSHFIRHKRELDNCPVMNWEVYRKMRLERDRGNGDCLWERPQSSMCVLLRMLILESQKVANLNTEVEVRPHQVKKLSISLCAKYWPKAKDLHLERVTGNKSFGTLDRCYIKKAPSLGMALSLPLGTAPLKNH